MNDFAGLTLLLTKHQPDITFFHEKLQDRFFDRFRDRDWDKVDLVIVIGTSMTVAPVSEIPIALPPHIPHINISRDVSCLNIHGQTFLLTVPAYSAHAAGHHVSRGL